MAHDSVVTSSKRKILSLGEILADKTPKPPDIISGGILPDKALLIIYGPPKVKKSFLAMNIGLRIATGKNFAGLEVPRAEKVLALSAEGGYYPMRDRIQKMQPAVEGDEGVSFKAWLDTRLNLSSADDVTELKEVLAEYQPKVVIIDPLVRFHNAEENSAQEMSAVFGQVRHLIEDNDVSVILVHHSGKDETRGLRGSSAIAGEYDSAIQISEQEGIHSLTFDLRHAEQPADVHLKFNQDTFWFEGYSSDPVAMALKNHPAGIVKQELVKVLVGSKGYKRENSAYKAIDRSLKNRNIDLRKGLYFSRN